MSPSTAVSLITGGGGVIGSVVARRLAARGDTVVIVDRDRDAAEQVATEINGAGAGEAWAVATDVASDDANKRLIAEIRNRYGRLTNLINNAGMSQTARFGELTHAEWTRVLDVNLWGAASLCQAAAPLWREDPGGAIVNLSSRTWLAGGPLAYVASKAALVGITHALAAELGRYSVTVNAIAPSFIPAPRIAAMLGDAYDEHVEHAHTLPLLPRVASADDVADTIAFLTSAGASFISGEIIHICGGGQLPARAVGRR